MKIALYFDCQNVSHVFLRDVISYCQNERYEIIIKKRIKILPNIVDGMRICTQAT